MYPRAFKILNFIVREKIHHGSRAVLCIGNSTLRIEQCKSEVSYSRYHQVRLVQLCRRLAAGGELPGKGATTGSEESTPKKASSDNLSPQASATSRLKEAVIKVLPRKKERAKFDTSHPSTERNFITAVRAMSEFLLKPSDLENLRKTKRRSPFENEPPITVYWWKDVEAKLVIFI
ncbi:hypothetical protein OTU49_005146 [Cherax quadricarinatus]|uniref:Uncharacterized protein n=1 Tax=Cherax quadricarinatus TaxID=27406 RepID=A0AAW0WUK3_CHEQU